MPRLHAADIDVSIDLARARRARYAAGKPTGGRKRGTHRVAKMDRMQFVAVDGEGWDTGTEIEAGGIDPETGKPKYVYCEHSYTHLASYDGYSGEHSELSKGGAGLSCETCLDFLCDIQGRYPQAIMVCYGASYDINQMLRDLTREECAKVCESNAKHSAMIDRGGKRYFITYQPRKVFRVQRFDNGQHYELHKGKYRKRKPDAKFTLWDVIGFFQCSFTKTLEDWLGKDCAQLAYIKEWKKKRATFADETLEDISAYNRAENEALVLVMEALATALKHPDVDLRLNRWDGAGAVAGALYKKHDIKDHLQDTEALHPEVFAAARGAYSGGHIEAFKIGYQVGPIYHADIRSAYPAHIRNLPSLGAGQWIHGKRSVPPPGFTVVRTRWHFNAAPFYPLFYRFKNGRILYPQHGHGWHWFPEFEVARDFAARQSSPRFEVMEWWHWQEYDPAVRPFVWIEALFNRRAELKRLKSGGGAQIVIKLGLNSLYGKMAQQVGFREEDDGSIRKPPYFQLEWAGFVTAATRAQAMRALLENPNDAISCATDGVYSLKPFSVPIGEKLGQWEAEKHSAMCMVMPGFYMHENEGHKWKSFSRGFDKDGTVSETNFYRNLWARGKPSVAIEQRRLIGLRQALTSDMLWPMRGCWAASTRKLMLSGDNSKRQALGKGQHPHLRLCATLPKNNEPGYTLSRKHDLQWKAAAEASDEWDTTDDDWETE